MHIDLTVNYLLYPGSYQLGGGQVKAENYELYLSKYKAQELQPGVAWKVTNHC